MLTPRNGVGPAFVLPAGMKRYLWLIPLVPVLPMIMGAQGDGCAAGSTSPAPDVRGTWSIVYDDMIGIEVSIGGAVYNAEATASRAASFTINHKASPTRSTSTAAGPTSCARARLARRGHRRAARRPAPAPDGRRSPTGDVQRRRSRNPRRGSCGDGTNEPELRSRLWRRRRPSQTAQAFGVIGESGDSFRLFLGGGIVTNGINCAMLGYSVADADLVTSGAPATHWEATR